MMRIFPVARYITTLLDEFGGNKDFTRGFQTDNNKCLPCATHCSINYPVFYVNSPHSIFVFCCSLWDVDKVYQKLQIFSKKMASYFTTISGKSGSKSKLLLRV